MTKVVSAIAVTFYSINPRVSIAVFTNTREIHGSRVSPP